MSSTAWSFYLIAAAGAAAVYCLLPGRRRGRAGWTGLGVVLGAAAIAGLIGWLVGLRQVRDLMPLAHPTVGPFFYLFAVIALVTAVKTIAHPRPIYSALYFVLTVLAVGGAVLLAAAEFVAVALILVYAGAILVVYVFVILLAAPDGRLTAGGGANAAAWPAADYDLRNRNAFGPLLLGFLLLAALAGPLANRANWPTSVAPEVRWSPPPAAAPATQPAEPAVQSAPPPGPAGHVAAVGAELFGENMVAVELAGVLLLVAIVGGIALARKRVTDTEPQMNTDEPR